METILDTIVEQTVAFLCGKFELEILILYGSYANGLGNSESDIDLIGFADVPDFVHESGMIDGHILDAWIYPVAVISDISKTMHILPCRILIDKGDRGPGLLRRIEEERKRNTKKLSGKEREQMDGWVGKMLRRAGPDGPEARYRYTWLLNDFPELYCNYSGIYYDGPIKTIKNILAGDAELGPLYFGLLGREKDIKKLEELYTILLSR